MDPSMQAESSVMGRRRRFPQFSIRSILAILTVLALVLSLHAYRQTSANRQIAAISEIRRLGGFTHYCYVQDENWNPGKKTYPDWLENKVGQDYLYAIDAFVINSRPNADPAIEIAATLPALRLVKLPGCKITDNSIKPLAKLKRLEWLELFATPVTDDCMDTISRIRSLKTLDLRRTNVTDNSIDDIVNLPHLRNLYIGKSAISEEGVVRIRKRMPKCNVDTRM
jgi:hypothetical protein